jgi:hypothetical protein
LKYSNELQAALKNAQAIVAERERAQTALTTAEQDLRVALETHAQAEGDLEAAIARAAVNGSGETAAERQDVDKALRMVSNLTSGINGLKAFLRNQEAELQAALDALVPELGPHNQELTDDFLARYKKSADAMAKLLAEKAALEEIGCSIYAPDPRPAEDYALRPEAAAPGRAAQELRDALGKIVEARRYSAAAAKHTGVVAVAARYRCTRGFVFGSKSVQAGEIIAGSELEPGAIAMYVENRRLVPLPN